MRDKEWLKLTRIRLHLSMEDVASKMFVTKQTICNLESGKSTKKSTMLLYEGILLFHMKETPLKELTEEELKIWKEAIEAMR